MHVGIANLAVELPVDGAAGLFGCRGDEPAQRGPQFGFRQVEHIQSGAPFRQTEIAFDVRRRIDQLPVVIDDDVRWGVPSENGFLIDRNGSAIRFGLQVWCRMLAVDDRRQERRIEHSAGFESRW